MNDQPEWLDQQTQHRLNELEISAAKREVLLQQTLVDTKDTKDINTQFLYGSKDFEDNTQDTGRKIDILLQELK